MPATPMAHGALVPPLTWDLQVALPSLLACCVLLLRLLCECERSRNDEVPITNWNCNKGRREQGRCAPLLGVTARPPRAGAAGTSFQEVRRRQFAAPRGSNGDVFAKIRSSLVPDELPASNWRADCPIRAATAPLGCLAMGPLTQLSSLSAI
jgi:hypothetical protein